MPVPFILLAVLVIEQHQPLGSVFETVIGMVRAVTVAVSLTVLVLLPAGMRAERAAASSRRTWPMTSGPPVLLPSSVSGAA
jgi:hypothetical protein